MSEPSRLPAGPPPRTSATAAGSEAGPAPTWRQRQTALDTWQRSRVAGFLYVFGWAVVAWLGDVHRTAPVATVVAAAAFLVFAVLRWRSAPPESGDAAALARWRIRYAIALTLAPALWAGLQCWLLLDPRLDPDVVMASMIATIGYATVIVNVYSPMRRSAAIGAGVLFLPMLAVLWADPARRGMALAASLYATYLVGALLRSHAEYRRRLDLDAELREQHDRFALLSRTDPLTGLANRRDFTERLALLAAAGGGFALLVFDVDHFKRVNDRHGHAVGDACLQAIAARMRAAFPPTATLARLGGEEFGVLLAAGMPAAAAAEAFRETLAAVPLRCDGVPVAITVSIGVGDFERVRHEDGDGLYRAVDAALYEAKRRGRNRVQAVDAGD
jgi:diguanylate cyclase (GGDEF)-like protein